MATFTARLKQLWNHPAGPKTVFFWAPTMKWVYFFSSSHLRKECQGEVGGCKSLSKP